MISFSSAEEVADAIRPLLPHAKRAYGSQLAGSDAREASEMVNAILLVYTSKGGRLPELAKHLEGDIALSGLRRRIRIARGVDSSTMEGIEPPSGKVPRKQGSKDPERIKEAVEAIQATRKKNGGPGGRAYGDAVRKAYDDGLSLQAIADEIGVTYYTLWSAKRTSW